MSKVNIKDIESLSFDEGKKVLLDNGYIESNTSREEEVASCDYAEDFYFTLFDEDNTH